MSSSTNDYGWINVNNASDYKRITTTNPNYSPTVRGMLYCPICAFESDRGSVILFFGGISSGTITAIDNQIGVIVEDKDYTDLENDTLIIYSTSGTLGTYATALYLDDEVINGKIYQRFNDVNLWDVTNQQLIKNLTTYYGNGTDWIQIK